MLLFCAMYFLFGLFVGKNTWEPKAPSDMELFCIQHQMHHVQYGQELCYNESTVREIVKINETWRFVNG